MGADDTWLAPLIHVEQLLGLAINPICRLAALGGMNAEETLRLSKAQTRELTQYREGIGSMTGLGELAYRQGATTAKGIFALRGAFAGHPPDLARLEEIYVASKAKFPVKSADLIDSFQGPALGKRLKELEAEWIASNFTKTKAQLLG
jgi:poly(A) polymerase